MVSLSYLGRTQLLLVPAIILILEYLSTWGQTPAAQSGAHISPASGPDHSGPGQAQGLRLPGPLPD